MSPPPMLEKRNSRRLSSNTMRTVNTSTSSSSSMEERKKSLSLVYPVEAPPFKISDIRNAIPSHCFKKSYFYSLLYASRDAAGILFLGYLASFIHTLSFPPLVKALLWCVYWYTCGCVATGWWMIGHECGHGAFSDSKVLNYIVGFIAHTSLFVPFSSFVANILAPSQFHDAKNVISILNLTNIVFTLTYFSTLGSWRVNKSHDYSISIVTGVFINLIVSFSAVPYFGIIGAAYANLIANIITVLVSFYLSSTRYQYNYSYWHITLQICAAIVYLFVPPSITNTIIFCIISTMLYSFFAARRPKIS